MTFAGLIILYFKIDSIYNAVAGVFNREDPAVVHARKVELIKLQHQESERVRAHKLALRRELFVNASPPGQLL